jgi:transcriptional regulator with XRE-family HTH domain
MSASPQIAPTRQMPPRKLPAPPKRGRKRLPRPPITTLREAINTHVGGRLRALRIAQGKTQAELGQALGLTNQQIQKYEKGINNITLERLVLAAHYLGIEFDYLLEGLETVALTARPADAPVDPVKHRRLRLAVAEALRRADSASLLSSILQLLRAAEDHAADRTRRD